jgi:MtrB/PioB family decaheme-associated outer membrane protein
MLTPEKRLLRTLAIAPLLLGSGIAQAEVDTSDWLCESCPFEDGYRAVVDGGITSVSDEAARFGNGTGYDSDGVYLNLDGHGRYVSDDYRLDWYAEDLGVDSRVYEMEAGKPGSFGVRLGYSELPYRRFDTTRTVFNAPLSDVLTLPSGWTPGANTSDMAQLDSSLRREDIGSDRQNIEFGASWQPAATLRLFADYRRQNRDGIDITSGTNYTQATFLPRWIDYTTDQVDAGVRYAGERTYLKLAFYGSYFSNQALSLTWDTPFTSTPGTERMQLATPPDNKFQQVSISGSHRATAWDTVLAFSLASGTGEQDDALLSYTINPDVPTAALPSRTLDGEVKTSNYAFTVTSRPFPRARVKIAYRYDERDNSTPQFDWSRVVADLFSVTDSEQNIPYSFERSAFSLSGELRLWKDIRVSGGWDRKEVERDFQEVAEQTIDAGWGQLRWRPLAWLDLRVKGGASERDIDRYNEDLAASFGQNPLLRKYNLAYRYRSYGELIASITPLESPLSFTMTALYADDRYNKSMLGMTDSEEVRATADLSWAVSENASVYFMAGYDVIDALQLGSEQFGYWDWSATHEDRFNHLGFGFNWRKSDGKFDLSVDYNRGDGESRVDVYSLSGGDSRLPDLTSTLDSARIEALFRINERLQGTASLRYERFEVEDYALVSPDTVSTVLTLGADPYDYDVWAVGLGVRYSFGGGTIELAD